MRVKVKSELIRWACERAGLDVGSLAQRQPFRKLPDWISGDACPTFKQLEAFAKATYTPFGCFFLPQPPKEYVPIPDLRTIGNEHIDHPSPDLLDTIYICQQRQEWYRDFARSTGEKPLVFVGSVNLASDVVEVAATIQGHLLPQSSPDFPCFRIHAMSNPTRHVAGDTYDLLVQDGDLVVTVTDVSGKGVGAGLIASGVQAGVRLLVPEDFRLEDLASRLNGFLFGATDANRFATFAMIRVVTDGTLYGVNAGHCPVLVRRCDGRVEQIDSSGLPLGILDGVTYTTERVSLESGDTVFLYTDGLTEAEDPEEEEFGQERLSEVVALSPCEAGPQAACRAIFEAVEAHTRGLPLHDDATLVAVQWVG